MNVEGPNWTRNLWTGPVKKTINGIEYEPTGGPDGTLMGIEGSESGSGPSGSRARAYVFVHPESVRRSLSQDIGPAKVTIRWIVSRDKGHSWIEVDKFIGRLSAPQIDLSTGVYSFDLETYSGDADRSKTEYWSDSVQRAKESGDKGMEYLAQLEAGGFDIEWPP